MATTAVAMDLDQCEGSKGKSSSALSINKSSTGKISKSSSLRKNNPIVQQAKPMPTSKVYNTDPMSFRNLVQQLTGCDAPPSDPNPSLAPPPARTTNVSEASSLAPPSYHPSLSAYQPQQAHQNHQLHQVQVHQNHQLHQVQQVQAPRQPVQPQVMLPDPGAPPRHMHVDPPLPGSPSSASSGVSSPHQSGSRPVNTRLQRMAPPPLRPTFSFSLAHKLAAQQQNSQQVGGAGGGAGERPASEHINSPGAHPLSPISKRVSPMPLLSFSPLPVLSPSDTAWANFESPNTAAMKQLAQSIIDGKGACAGRFPWSPLGLASPGPVPELFPDVRMSDPPDTDVKRTGNATTTNSRSNNKTNNNNNNEFSFPEL